MSDHWEFFPCQVGEHQGFIFYDHGVRDEINDLGLSKLLRVRVSLRAPRDDGLPTNDEFEPLKSIEDELSKEIEKLGGIYVGRISVAGKRHFYGYVEASDDEIASVIDRLSGRTGYDMAHAMTDDPEKKGYWEDLFPTAQDWRVILDLKVIEQLEEHGDSLETERRVDHWAYFPELSQLEEFRRWAEGEGFSVDNVSEPDEQIARHGIEFFHNCAPMIAEISRYTILLMDKAEEYGGEYDGWGTGVEKSVS